MLARRSIAALVALALSLSALGAGVAAAAKPGEVTVFKTDRCSFPRELGAAPAEGVLFRLCKGEDESRISSTLANLLPDGQLVTHEPTALEGPVISGPAGEIWACATAARVVRIAADGTVSIFPLGTPGGSGLFRFYGMVPDGAGGVWIATGELVAGIYGFFTDSSGGELVHVAADGTATQFPVPETIEPRGLARGSDGNLWFTGIEGSAVGQHADNPGIPYVGRMTPTGEFKLFPIPDPNPSQGVGPSGIAVGPDDRLWFAETGYAARQIATIGTDGTFGPSHYSRLGLPLGPLTFGPEGDVWFPVLEKGLARMTPMGQTTLYPQREEGLGSVVTGPEGAIWTLESKAVKRIVPGGPGIDVSELTANPRSRTVTLHLACGGSTRTGCKGELNLALEVPRGDPHLPKGVKEVAPIRLFRVAYSLPAEAATTRKIAIPAKNYAVARRYLPRAGKSEDGAEALVRATVSGGPTVKRRFWVPGLVAANAP